jgi:hypothetical protein
MFGIVQIRRLKMPSKEFLKEELEAVYKKPPTVHIQIG